MLFVLNEYNIIKLKQFYKSRAIFIKKFLKDKIYKNTNNSYKTNAIVHMLIILTTKTQIENLVCCFN